MVLALGLVLSATGCGKKEDSVLTGSTVKLADGGVYPIQCDDELTVWGQLDTNLSTQVSNFGETELAKKLGIKQPTVGQYLSGRAMPALDTFANLCAILDLDPAEILCLNEFNKNS